MTSTINATTAGGGGVVTTGDSSGSLALQANGTTVVTAASGGATTSIKQYIDAVASGGLSDWSQLQLQIRGTNTNQRLSVGYDTTNEVGVIQAGKNGTGWMPLWLNPVGGYVYVTETLSVRRVAGTYGVDITTNNSTGNTTISPVGSGATLTIPDLTISGKLTGIGSNSVLVNQSGDLALTSANTWYNGPNTGSIGASGQRWLIVACGSVLNTGQAVYGEIAIHDGTNFLAAQGSVGANSSWPALGTASYMVTLSGATTFTLKAAANAANSTLKGVNSYNTTISPTYIYALRLS